MKGTVATSEIHAARAGIGALEDGGNATDAALAAAMCLPVVEPTGNGLGGDLFALVWDGERVAGLDSAGASSATLCPDALRGGIPASGGAPVTVPGLPAGWEALHRRYARLAWDRLLAPAIALAHDGFPVRANIAAAWARSEARLGGFDEWARVFLPAPAPGQVFRNPDLARTLEVLARGGADALYTGPLAARVADAVRRTGGWLEPEDLAAHRARWVEPLSARWGAWTVFELPPPTQGLVALLALLAGGEDLHTRIEATKLAFGRGWDLVADGADVRAALSDAAIAELRASIGPRAAPGPVPPGDGHGTVLVCAGDEEGRLVTLIQSNFHGFGSGVVVPGTGIALQNRGLGFVPRPGHPNSAAPGRRPFHTLIPGLVLGPDGRGLYAFGNMGGQMQPQGHVQVLGALRDGATPQQAVDQPRWRWVPEGDRVLLERGFPARAADELAARGHRVVPEVGPEHFGGAQVVSRTGGGGSDRRKDGAALTTKTGRGSGSAARVIPE